MIEIKTLFIENSTYFSKYFNNKETLLDDTCVNFYKN